MKRYPLLLGLALATLFSCSHRAEQLAMHRSKNKSLKGHWDPASRYYDEEFAALNEADFSDSPIPQPKDIPGAPGSGIPSLDQFRKAFAELAQIFQNVYFSTDDYVLRGSEHIKVIEGIASYLKKHPQTYISVGGHCDERGSEAYNLALGTKRANYVRTLLVQRGVDPNQIHSISYGKEQPLDGSHSSTAWSKNRRAEFKIYEKQ